MKGDFSRLTFDPSKQFTRVLMQQGSVQLDADWNEQSAILLHYLQTLAADLIGPFGGPAGNDGFNITPVKGNGGSNVTDLEIGYGRYYVDGLLCENRKVGADPKKNPKTDLDTDTNANAITLRSILSHLPGEVHSETKFPPLPFLVYLDVWERHVTYVEDDSIREVALGGPDTATRAQVVWQVRWTDKMPDGKTALPKDLSKERVWEKWQEWMEVWQSSNRGSLEAQAKPDPGDADACVASPAARYRGPENQLYRVEVHKGGTAAAGATFKWSRDNGSMTFPILDLDTDSGTKTTTVTLEHLGRDGRPLLATDDWVEIVDDSVVLGRETVGPLLQVATVDADRARVTLRGVAGSPVGQDAARHPLLRRWDHSRSRKAKLVEGALAIVEGANQWIDLEDGVQVSFQPAQAGAPAPGYRAGDYWLIPARTATGDVEWPGPPGTPEARPPHGVHHRYAPLALLKADGAPSEDLRRPFRPLVTL